VIKTTFSHAEMWFFPHFLNLKEKRRKAEIENSGLVPACFQLSPSSLRQRRKQAPIFGE